MGEPCPRATANSFVGMPSRPISRRERPSIMCYGRIPQAAPRPMRISRCCGAARGSRTITRLLASRPQSQLPANRSQRHRNLSVALVAQQVFQAVLDWSPCEAKGAATEARLVDSAVVIPFIPRFAALIVIEISLVTLQWTFLTLFDHSRAVESLIRSALSRWTCVHDIRKAISYD
jgi:hypothetical protein